MTIATRLYTWLFGELVGRDAQGNRYYRDKRGPRFGRERRWVVYEGEAEASRVPPEWHGWLHHMFAEPPTVRRLPRHPWMKPHQPNRTGTPEAYRPPGSEYQGGRRPHTTGDYEPWRPN
jgi:NADH:ubiquinone oxidoreductase subunit